ncbi:hypothetical protein ABZ690_19320 [Streptomyces sp. NPDC006967]|uniref:hypothetical protein n=1 Tax=unclassified Streptomyces TaxID=2593676 RepID=UPI0033E64357
MIAEAIDTAFALGWAFAGWLAVAAAVASVVVFAAGATGVWAYGLASPRRRAARRADRALLRLARERCGNPACPTCRALTHRANGDPHVKPAHLAHLAATEDEQRSPDWCHAHGCHRSQRPAPE